MLISYRDSVRYPSDELALRAWVRLAELAARQIVCRNFDALQFARALELCRRLTCRERSEALHRVVTSCAAAGVAVVVVPNFDRCHLFSASKWLVCGSKTRRAMIALSIRYRRDDQFYFSFFREAGAILMAEKTEVSSGKKSEVSSQRSEGERATAGRSSDFCPLNSDFSPDCFARQFLIPPEHDSELAALTAAVDPEQAVRAFAAKLGVAPGLVVGRMQHDGLIGWKELNPLKRRVDLSWVLRMGEAMEETWPDQTAATRQVMGDFGLEESAARERVRRAAARGELLTNGQQRKELRLEPGRLAAWRLTMRDRDLDAEEREEAA